MPPADTDAPNLLEEYKALKYEGDDPDLIFQALWLLEREGLEKAVAATGRSQEWIEKWERLYSCDQILRDTILSDPFYRALLDLARLHPQKFRDLWAYHEQAQVEQIEAVPVSRKNIMLTGFPFVRGRIETPELERDRELSRKIRAARRK